jgi:perosamine synthetase
MIQIAQPMIGEEEEQAVLAVLRSGALVQGERVAAFERAFADYHGAAHGVAVNNGTAALVAALMAHGIGPGDEVILPAFSFFAAAAAVLSVGATPVFADIDPETFCLSPDAAAAAITARTAAILAIHLYGCPADLPRLEALCRRRGLLLLEDAAQAHGAAIAGRRVGTWGTAAFSFYPSKNMTTIEGGMVLTNDAAIARRLRMIRNHGADRPYTHELLGYNFRMNELTAALGTVQLGRLPAWNARRWQNACGYDRHLTGVITPVRPPGYEHVFHQYTVRIPTDRDRAVRRLHTRGIEARVYYATPLHRQPLFRAQQADTRFDLPETDRAAREVLSLPVHPALTADDLAHVIAEVNALCTR